MPVTDVLQQFDLSLKESNEHNSMRAQFKISSWRVISCDLKHNFMRGQF